MAKYTEKNNSKFNKLKFVYDKQNPQPQQILFDILKLDKYNEGCYIVL